VAGLHESIVQQFPSSQLSGTPPTHIPDAHVSPVVQAFPSLQEFVLFACTQPVEGSQLSVVHGFLSLHTTAAPEWQIPPPQTSPAVQAFPSLHASVLFV
jgi:hypothetical protein